MIRSEKKMNSGTVAHIVRVRNTVWLSCTGPKTGCQRAQHGWRHRAQWTLTSSIQYDTRTYEHPMCDSEGNSTSTLYYTRQARGRGERQAQKALELRLNTVASSTQHAHLEKGFAKEVPRSSARSAVVGDVQERVRVKPQRHRHEDERDEELDHQANRLRPFVGEILRAARESQYGGAPGVLAQVLGTFLAFGVMSVSTDSGTSLSIGFSVPRFAAIVHRAPGASRVALSTAKPARCFSRSGEEHRVRRPCPPPIAQTSAAHTRTAPAAPADRAPSSSPRRGRPPQRRQKSNHTNSALGPSSLRSLTR